jgi:hypothetical protein
LRRDAQLVVLDDQNNFISDLDAQRLTKLRRYDDAAVFIDPHSGFLCHDIIVTYVITT